MRCSRKVMKNRNIHMMKNHKNNSTNNKCCYYSHNHDYGLDEGSYDETTINTFYHKKSFYRYFLALTFDSTHFYALIRISILYYGKRSFTHFFIHAFFHSRIFSFYAVNILNNYSCNG